jgi:actin-related protein 10
MFPSRSLKTGGTEVAREKWDEADPSKRERDDDMDVSADFSDRSPMSVLPDWTRMPLPVGAPSAVSRPTVDPPSPMTAVGA